VQEFEIGGTNMQFVSANPSVVRSIKQRVLLNAWLRVLRKPRPLQRDL
jgi:hypothetical protein